MTQVGGHTRDGHHVRGYTRSGPDASPDAAGADPYRETPKEAAKRERAARKERERHEMQARARANGIDEESQARRDRFQRRYEQGRPRGRGNGLKPGEREHAGRQSRQWGTGKRTSIPVKHRVRRGLRKSRAARKIRRKWNRSVAGRAWKGTRRAARWYHDTFWSLAP